MERPSHESAPMERPTKPMGNTGRRRRSCPPHGPVLAEAVVIGEVPRGWVARCLACGLAGAEREEGLEANLAFDEVLDALT
jgi:hypothetical protein